MRRLYIIVIILTGLLLRLADKIGWSTGTRARTGVIVLSSALITVSLVALFCGDRQVDVSDLLLAVFLFPFVLYAFVKGERKK